MVRFGICLANKDRTPAPSICVLSPHTSSNTTQLNDKFMRLEIEQSPSPIPFAEEANVEASTGSWTLEAAEYLREGIKAAQAGNRGSARIALTRAAELDPRSESAWLWLSSISEYPEELFVFLSNVLEINPENSRALEWAAATKSLLAKNFVQRGIDAAEANQPDAAVQFFNQALEYDEQNSMAWLWLASLSDSNEGKMSYLEKVLEFDPENEAAGTAYKAARDSIRANLLAEARTAAVAGNAVEANELIDAILAEEPNAEDAWVLKSHLANGFDEKIEAFKRVLEINPSNLSAKASLESLTSIMEAVAPKVSESIVEEAVVEEVAVEEEVVEAAMSPVEVDEEVAVSDEFSDELTSEDEFDAETGTTEQTVEQFTAPLEVYEDTVDSEDVSYEGIVHVSESDEAAEEDSVVEFSPAETVDETEAEAEALQEEEVEEITYDLAPDAELADEPESFDVTQEAAEEYEAEESAAFSAIEPTPFGTEQNASAADDFPTIASITIDPDSFELGEHFGFMEKSSESVSVEADKNDVFNLPFDTTMFGTTIPRPDLDLDQIVPDVPTGFETRIVSAADMPKLDVVTTPCSFCTVENEAQAIVCKGCMSVLTLADLEMLLANHNADKSLLRQAVEKMESERSSRIFDEGDLTTLGIGHLNLRNLQYGYNYLHEASQLNPNNVVLAGQVNALLIRLEEIKQQDEAHESMVKGKTILVVDDSPTVRKLIAGKLEKCGHDVFCSNDGVEAMERLQDLRPDLVLLDITMPRMDGYQVCKLIRSNNAIKDVPVVMISGKDGFFDKVRGRMAGTSGYITKPFGPETLMKAVESYLNGETL